MEDRIILKLDIYILLAQSSSWTEKILFSGVVKEKREKIESHQIRLSLLSEFEHSRNK